LHKKKEIPIIVTRWHGKGFGEAVHASLFCHILNDNGIPSVYKEHRNTRGLLDVPLFDPDIHKDWVYWKWKYKLNDIPIMLQMIEKVEKWLEVKIKIHKKRNHIPIIFHKMKVPKYDVVMNTATGGFSPYKKWHYFSELKRLMESAKISYLDLDQNLKHSIECLNLVKRSKLYLGLDTGMSHYVSRFAGGKALILNGGFVDFKYWAYLYNNYELIQVVDVPCRPCYKNWTHKESGDGCQYENRCMEEISPEIVFERICERLGK
jgi:hypothetical protein